MTCAHGMPTPASCVDCMADGPVDTGPVQRERLLDAERWITANFESRCARCGSLIEIGELIGVVSGIGWCCEACVR